MRLLGLLLASTVWVASAAAQSMGPHDVFGRYQQANWQEREGLPQHSVLAITPTRDGYLWLGTYEGAARFDGVRFTLFNPGNTIGIPDSVVTALLETRNGDLWLATFGGGLSRYSGGRFTAYTEREGLASDFAKCLFEDRDGTLWIGTDDGGVASFREGRFSAYTVADGLPSNRVRVLIKDREGAVLAGTGRGVARIAAGRVTAWHPGAPFAHADITALAWHPDGSLWVAGARALYRVDAHDGVTAFGPRQGFPQATAESIFVDADGTVWVGTMTAGLFRYVAGRFESYGTADGLPGAGRVATIVPGAANELWLGTDGGLARLQRPAIKVYTRRDGLPNDYIGSLLQDADGSAWIWTGRGLTRFHNGAARVFTSEQGIPGDRIGGLARGADGFPLVYTRGGLVRWTGDRFTAVATDAAVPWNRVASLIEDRSGTLWIGIDHDGLMRVRDGHVTHLRKQDGLADDSVLSLYEDRRGAIWVGTSRNGMTRISPSGMTSWTTRDGLASNHVKTFREDSAGAMWIGTHGGGLSRFKDGTLATISQRQGLHNDNIFQILEDDAGSLWMNCNAGIWRNTLAQLNDVADGRRVAVESFAYGAADGMLSTEGVGATLAGWKMRDGSLWFPTTRGLVAIDPRRRDAHPPRVRIEGTTVDFKPIEIGDAVRLRPGQDNLEIRYTGLSWSRPQAIRFRFRLTGLDRDWVDAGSRRTAYYSHLPPGSYTFNVTADNGEGVWSEAGSSLQIVVLPRFHQTWWFIAVLGSSLVALIGLSWRYRLNQMRRAQAAHQAFSRQLIESQERERQRIAAELHDSLGQNLLVVKNRALLGALSPRGEDTVRQFQEIGATVAQTLEEVRVIAYNLRPHHLDQLGLTTTIRAMIDRMSESSTIGVSSDLDDIDGVFAPADEITIYRIIQESLNNVVKHSGAGQAHVAVHCLEHHVEIAIRDNGRGFGAVTAATNGIQRGGFGLKGLAQRVEMLGGTHMIESSPGRGTTVSVRIDVGRRRRESPHGT